MCQLSQRLYFVHVHVFVLVPSSRTQSIALPFILHFFQRRNGNETESMIDLLTDWLIDHGDDVNVCRDKPFFLFLWKNHNQKSKLWYASLQINSWERCPAPLSYELHSLNYLQNCVSFTNVIDTSLILPFFYSYPPLMSMSSPYTHVEASYLCALLIQLYLMFNSPTIIICNSPRV